LPAHPLIVVPIDSNPSAGRAGKLRYALALARGLVAAEELARIRGDLAQVEQQVQAAIREQVAALASPELAEVAWYFRSAFAAPALEQLWNQQPDAEAPIRDTLARLLTARFMARAVRCVVLHHHPMGIADTENLGMTHQDVYLTLANAGAFLQACRESNVSLILHGHKHFPCRMVVGLPGAGSEFVGVVGAGSATLRSSMAAPSANLIRIARTGEVRVSRRDLVGEPQPQTSDELVVRSWSQVKWHLQKVAEELSLWTVERVVVHVHVFDTGDALLTQELFGLKAKPGAIEHDAAGRWIRFPLRFDGVGGGEPEVACSTIDVTQRDRIGQAVRKLTYSPEIARARGFVRVDLTTEQVPALSFSVRYLAFASFATNPWQLWCLRKDHEACTMRVSLPTHDTFSLDVAFDGALPQLQRVCEDSADIVGETEQDSIQLDTSPIATSAHLSVRRPLWGVRYGVRWRIDRPTGTRGFRCLTLPQATLDRLAPRLEQAAAAHGAEVTLFVVAPTGGRHQLLPAYRAPAAAAARAPRTWPIGVGIAGRAAWLESTILWANPETPDTVDFYLEEPGAPRHEAIVAGPVHAVEGFPVAVLSAATRTDNAFARAVKAALGAGGEPRPERLDWYWQLLETVEETCLEA
jgi:hypothetical protein